MEKKQSWRETPSLDHRIYGVLFLCTGNSARSIIAECLLNRLGRGRFRAFSAGSHPTGLVNPGAQEILEQHDYPTAGLRSKSWDDFAQPAGPQLDFVFTVCANAAAETCPLWQGVPQTAHWAIPDPAAALGSTSDKRQAFADAFAMLTKRVEAFVDLPLASLDPADLQRELDNIGR